MARGDTPIDRRKFVGGTAAGLGLGLAGCVGGDGDGDGGDGGGGEDGGDGGTDTETGTGTPESPQEGGRPVFGMTTDLQSFNLFATGNESGLAVLNRIYDSLIITNPETERFTPWILQDWEINIDNFGTDSPAVTGTVIEGHTFSDGTELTAGDVAFTHNYMIENEPTNINQVSDEMEEVVADSEDGYTVNWFLTDPISDLLSQNFLRPVIPKHVWKDVSDFLQYEPRSEGGLIGSGAFTIGNTTRGEFYELEMRPKEEVPWNGMDLYPWLHPEGPFIDGMRMEIFQSSSAEFQAVLDGQLATTDATLNQAIQAQRNDDLRVLDSPSPSWVMIQNNTRRVPFDDVAFRQFLAKSYNQRWTVETQHQGISAKGGHYLVAEPWKFWRPPEVSELIDEDASDPYAAGEYMNEDLEGEDGVEPIDVPDLTYPADTAQWPKEGEVVQQLRDFLLNHPKAKHDYSIGEARSAGTTADDGQEIYVNGEPLGGAHTDSKGNPNQGPVEVLDYPPSQAPQLFEINTQFVESLTAAGVPMTRESMPWPSIQPRVYQEENFDLMAQTWPNRQYSVGYLGWMLSSGTQLDKNSTKSTTHWNGSGYNGADHLINTQDAMIDLEKRQPWVKQALVKLYHDQPQMVAYYPRVLTAVHADWGGLVRAIGGTYGDQTLLNMYQTQ